MYSISPQNASQIKPKSRKKLNSKQIEVLQILYKFRFATAELISIYQEQSKQYTNVRLKILEEQKYVGKNYDSSYKIQRRSATYYLLPDAIKLLKKDPELDAKGLHLLYYNRRAKPVFVSHHLRLMRLCIKLENLYGADLALYTSTELAELKNFPSPRPDLLLSFSGKYANLQDATLDLLESTTSLDRHRRRIIHYLNHTEQGGWNGDSPKLLLVCDNVGLEREVQRFTSRILNFKGNNQTLSLITSVRALISSRGTNDNIWSNVLEPDNPMTL